jgi:hypothetical protein
MAERIEYRSGGNPPLAAGLFMIDERGKRRIAANVVRLAFWPASVPPNDLNIQRVVTELVWRREDDKPVTREQIVRLLNGGRDDARR